MAEAFSHPIYKTREEFDARTDEILKQEMADNPDGAWWYLSFCDTGKPKGQQWIGGCFVFATGMVSAVATASVFGCNPGGEVAGWELPERFHGPTDGYAYRLLNREELEEADPGEAT